MDRFIGQANIITYDIIIDLKSNMDRFIVFIIFLGCLGYIYLKSNIGF